MILMVDMIAYGTVMTVAFCYHPNQEIAVASHATA